MIHRQVSFSKDTNYILVSGDGEHTLVLDADQMASVSSSDHSQSSCLMVDSPCNQGVVFTLACLTCVIANV